MIGDQLIDVATFKGIAFNNLGIVNSLSVQKQDSKKCLVLLNALGKLANRLLGKRCHILLFYNFSQF